MSNFLWSDRKGPFENLFHLIEMGAMVAGPAPLKMITFFASLFDLGLAELGGALDESIGLSTLQDIKSKTPEDAAIQLTTGLFDVTEEALAASAAFYSQNLIKYASIEQIILETPIRPQQIKKEAALPFLKKLLGKTVKGKGGPGFVGLFFNRILGLFRWAWTWFKRILVGGVGILALKGTDMLHSDEGGAAKIRGRDSESGSDEGLVDISTKEIPNPYKARLQEEIEEAMKL